MLHKTPVSQAVQFARSRALAGPSRRGSLSSLNSTCARVEPMFRPLCSCSSSQRPWNAESSISASRQPVPCQEGNDGWSDSRPGRFLISCFRVASQELKCAIACAQPTP